MPFTITVAGHTIGDGAGPADALDIWRAHPAAHTSPIAIDDLSIADM